MLGNAGVGLHPAESERLWGVFRVGVHRMLQGGQHHQRVHRCVQLDVVTGFRVVRGEVQDSCLVDIDAAEQVEGHQQVGQPQPPFAQLDQQVVDAIAKEAVAQFLIAALTVFFSDFLSIEHAANAVAPATGVGDDGRQHAAHVRIQAMAVAQPGGVLAFEAVGQVQPLGFFVSVEQSQADVGVAVQVGQAQQFAALEDERTMAATGQQFFGENRIKRG